MLRKILVGVAVVLVVLVLAIASRPATFHVERSGVVPAPPDVTFAQVNDFHAWEAWSPWAKLDPQMKTVYAGPSAGIGAVYFWSGNDKAGEGRMTLEKSESPKTIGIKLEFLKPFVSTNQTTFTFAPAPEGTKVTWSMDGANNFMSKAMSLVMDMDKMVGPDFEKGLASIGVVAKADFDARTRALAAAKTKADADAKAAAEAKAKADEEAAAAKAAEEAAAAKKSKKKK